MARVRTDQLSDLDALIEAADLPNPWRLRGGSERVLIPHWSLLESMLTVPVVAARASETGVFAKAVDAWVAHELRRAGFDEDEVWPRATRPRILPRDIAVLLDRLPRALADQVRERILDMPAVAPGDAHVLGRAYRKQVDVCIARWERGPELIVSTKAMVSSFANNVGNRFEEAYGDAFNLRGRFPLAAVGYLLVLRDTILLSPDVYERAVDMMRKLRSNGGPEGYTATGLILVNWSNGSGATGQASEPDGSVPVTPVSVTVVQDVVPEDVAAGQFFDRMIDCVLLNTPVQYHVEVRSRRDHRYLSVAEADDA